MSKQLAMEIWVQRYLKRSHMSNKYRKNGAVNIEINQKKYWHINLQTKTDLAGSHKKNKLLWNEELSICLEQNCWRTTVEGMERNSWVLHTEGVAGQWSEPHTHKMHVAAIRHAIHVRRDRRFPLSLGTFYWGCYFIIVCLRDVYTKICGCVWKRTYR